MHELALCEGVLAVALEAAEGRDVKRVKVRVGQLQLVVPESWEMCWRIATLDTVAQESAVDLAQSPARIRCQSCGAEGPPQPPLSCATCGGPEVRVLTGNELVVEEVELVGGEILANPSLATVASVEVEES